MSHKTHILGSALAEPSNNSQQTSSAASASEIAQVELAAARNQTRQRFCHAETKLVQHQPVSVATETPPIAKQEDIMDLEDLTQAADDLEILSSPGHRGRLMASDSRAGCGVCALVFDNGRAK